MTEAVRPSPRPARLPPAVLETLFPAPALLAGRLAASGYGTAWNYVQRWKEVAGVVQGKPVVRK